MQFEKLFASLDQTLFILFFKSSQVQMTFKIDTFWRAESKAFCSKETNEISIQEIKISRVILLQTPTTNAKGNSFITFCNFVSL